MTPLDQHRSLDRLGGANRRRIVDALRLEQPLARVQLAEATGLSAATVTAITADLLNAGLIEETTSDEETFGAEKVETRRGRPRVLLRLRPEALLVAGVNVSMHQIAVSVTDFVGDLLGAKVVPIRARRAPADQVAARIEEALRDALGALRLSLDDVSGVGMALPGFIDGDAGVSHWSPVFREDVVRFSDMMRARLGRPVFIDNDANLAALAEQWFGVGRGVANFVVVTIEHGVGMGAVVNGRLYRGARGFGAEFGHSKIQRSGALCRCGQRGCVEAYVADYAILREAGTIAPMDGLADPIEAAKALQRLIAAGEAGDPAICAIYARAGGVLGFALANLINIFGPELVLLTGGGVAAVSLFEDEMRAALEANTLSASYRATQVIVKPHADEMWAKGAAALVLERQDYPW